MNISEVEDEVVTVPTTSKKPPYSTPGTTSKKPPYSTPAGPTTTPGWEVQPTATKWKKFIIIIPFGCICCLVSKLGNTRRHSLLLVQFHEYLALCPASRSGKFNLCSVPNSIWAIFSYAAAASATPRTENCSVQYTIQFQRPEFLLINQKLLEFANHRRHRPIVIAGESNIKKRSR